MEKMHGNKLNRKKDNDTTYLFYTIIASLLLIAVFFLSLCVGRYNISLGDCIYIILFNGRETEMDNMSTAVNVIHDLRLPRTLAAMMVGMSLAVSGLIYQTTFANKLVSPDILGVSSGACVGAALAIILNLSGIAISVLAFLFGLLAVFFTLIIPHLIGNTSNLALVLSGVIVNSFMNSIIGLIKFLADPNKQLAEITFWMMGSIAGVKIEDVKLVCPVILTIIFMLILIRWRINILALGESNARSLGMNFKKMRLLIIVCSTLLTASTVCLSGSIGWVGLIIPHIARTTVGEDHCKNIPFTILCGGIFMILVDMIARSISTNEIPLSIVSGFIGTPIYVILLMRKGLNDAE